MRSYQSNLLQLIATSAFIKRLVIKRTTSLHYVLTPFKFISRHQKKQTITRLLERRLNNFINYTLARSIFTAHGNAFSS